MKRRCFILSGIGFLMGMVIGNLIAWITSGTPVNSKIAAWVGSDAGSVVIQMLLSGLLGAIAMGSAVIHEIEEWSLARCAVTHYLLIEAAYVPVALLLGWADDLTELLIMLGIQLIVYLIIWVIMYLRYKAEVRKLNELLQKDQIDREKEN